jgi:hypothetical protein
MATSYDGATWSTPVSIDTGTNSVTSLSCVPSFCVAVDNVGNEITFNGSGWSAVSVDASHALTSVSCTSSVFCVAVDDAGNAVFYTGTWATVPIDAGNQLTSVSCASSSFCVAVDNAGNAAVYTGTWASPVSVDGTSQLTSVSCASSSFCAAADITGNAMTYDGKAWSSPVRADSHAAMITALSCASPGLCVAVDTDNYAFLFAPTTTVITTTPTAPQPLVGEAVNIEVQVTSAVAGRTPTGQVKVTDGFHSCTASVSGSGGVATGSCSVTELVVGSYPVVATYGPNSSFGSSSSAQGTLNIAAASSSTSLTSSTGKVTYGHEQVATVSVLVSPELAVLAPTGAVTIEASATTVCVAALQAGYASCTLPARALPVGVFSLVASYPGNTVLDGSTSGTTLLTVVKESAKTALRLSAGKVTRGHEKSETLSVKVSAKYAGSTPTGRVTVKRASKTVCVITLSKGNGSCRLSATKLAVGSYRLVASYGGSANFAPSTSSKETLVVVK